MAGEAEAAGEAVAAGVAVGDCVCAVLTEGEGFAVGFADALVARRCFALVCVGEAVVVAAGAVGVEVCWAEMVTTPAKAQQNASAGKVLMVRYFITFFLLPESLA